MYTEHDFPRARQLSATCAATRSPRANLIRKLGLVAAIGFACSGAAFAADIQLPPINDPPSTEHHVGKVVFVELVTPDVAAAKTFYSGLFGWTFRDMKAGTRNYAQASLNGESVAGLIEKKVDSNEHRQPAWLGFIAVRDVDAAEKAAVKAGAKVLYEPHSIGGRGREAVFADPQGAVFAVLASSSGDPPDELADPGEWIWSSLITTDPDKDAAFYQTLFDYDVTDVSEEDSAQHLVLATDNFARLSANSLPSNKPTSHPHWLNFVRVEDAAKMVAKVEALGGKVLVEPRDDRQGGKIAVVADPQGARFGLMEWSTTGSSEVTK